MNSLCFDLCNTRLVFKDCHMFREPLTQDVYSIWCSELQQRDKGTSNFLLDNRNQGLQQSNQELNCGVHQSPCSAFDCGSVFPRFPKNRRLKLVFGFQVYSYYWYMFTAFVYGKPQRLGFRLFPWQITG